MSTTVEESEIKRFKKESHNWRKDDGTYSSLHKITPLRVDYILDNFQRHLHVDEFSKKPLKGMKILDIGCGGGLVSEPLAHLGGEITGIDADASAIEIAAKHAEKEGLKINYQCGTAEDHLKTHARHYDAIIAMEILEHVSDVDYFIKCCAGLCAYDGLLIFSTLNRTAKSYALGVLAAERALRWVPKGTHDWNKFIRPSELAKTARSHRLELKEIKGFSYNVMQDTFRLSSDTDINYFAVFKNRGEI